MAETQGQKDASKIRKIGNRWTKKQRKKLDLEMKKIFPTIQNS